MRGYSGNENGYTTTEAQKIYLDEALLPLSIGDYERTKHDIAGQPVVPKIDVVLNDVFVFNGYSNSVPVSYNLSSDYSSLLDEIFDDDTLVYELWIDDWFGNTLFEVWFGGDIDAATIPIAHKLIDNEGTATATRMQEYSITANFAIERFTRNAKRQYLVGQTAYVPGGIMDFAYGKSGGRTLLWGTVNSDPIYVGSCGPWPWTNNFGHTGPASTGMVLKYIWTKSPTNIQSIAIPDLATLIAEYGGSNWSAVIDPNLMFDLYLQKISNDPTTGAPLIKVAGNGVDDWSAIFVNLNFLLGNGIPMTGSFDGANVSLTQDGGYISDGNLHVKGTLFGFTSLYFQGNVSGTDIFLRSNNSSYSLEEPVNGDQVNLSGTITGGIAYLSGSFAGSTVYLSGPFVAGVSIGPLVGTSPLLYAWPNTIDMKSDVLTLVAYLCAQTFTWMDAVIDIDGDVTMYFRARRAFNAPSPSYFAFTHISLNDDVLISGSSQEPGEVTQTGVSVKAIGDSLAMIAGDENNALALTVPFRSHKQGEYIANDGNTFYNPNNDLSQCIEQWWDTTVGADRQMFCVTCDAKVSRPDNVDDLNPGQDDYRYVSPNPIPTDRGWVGGSMLLYNRYTDQTSMFASNEWDYPSDTTTANVVIAAILPSGYEATFGLPKDEFCGGYFLVNTALAQLSYLEIIDKKIVLNQDYIGCRGDDGYIQSLRPGLLMRTFIRGAYRTLELHSVKQNVGKNTCALQWIGVLDTADYLAKLPAVFQSGGGGSSGTGGTGATAGGGGASTGSITSVSVSITATVNDFALSIANIYRITSSDSISPYAALTGVASGTTFGRVISLVNVGTNPIVIPNQSALSLAANRFQMADGQDLDLLTNQNVSFWYDSVSNFWRELA